MATMKSRKPRPVKIYREEVHNAGTYNRSRQTFDEDAFNAWVTNWNAVKDRIFGDKEERKFFVGTIEWEEVTDGE